MQRFSVKTGSRNQFVDITGEVEKVVAQSGVSEGACVVYIPHTTCGVTINENADPDVQTDILSHLSGMIPHSPKFRHSEGNSDSHIKASLVGSSATVPISGGSLSFGTWQSIFLCEFDGPRTRSVMVSILQ